MEPLAKRARIGAAPYDEDDELCLEPEEVNAQRDPAVLLEKQRAVAVYKLKSRWESVFEKYSNIAEDEGDEIDFETGEIVRNNGHIESMDSKGNDDDVEAEEEEEDRILHGKATGGQLCRLLAPGPSIQSSPFRGQLATSSPSLFGTPRLSTMFSPGPQFSSTFGAIRPFGSFVTPNRPVEPAWEVPEIPIEAHEHSSRPVSRAVVPRKNVKWKPPPSSNNEADEDDDDILLGSTNLIGKERKEQSVVSSPVLAVTALAQAAQPPPRPGRRPPELNIDPDETSEQEATIGPSAAEKSVEGGLGDSRLPTKPPTDAEEAGIIVSWVKKGRPIEVVLTRSSRKAPPTKRITEAQTRRDTAVPVDLPRISIHRGVVSSSPQDNIPATRQLTTAQEGQLRQRTPAGASELEPAEPQPVASDVSPPTALPPRPTTPIQQMTSNENIVYPEGETPPSLRRRRRDRLNPRLQVPASSELLYRSPRYTTQSKVRSKKLPRRSLPTHAADSQLKEGLEEGRRHSLPSSLQVGQLSPPASSDRDDINTTTSAAQADSAHGASRLQLESEKTHEQQLVPEENSYLSRRRPSPVREQFSRNTMDASYAFSDEDESLVPRRRSVTSGLVKQAQLQVEAAVKRKGRARPPKTLRLPLQNDATHLAKECPAQPEAHAESSHSLVSNSSPLRDQTPPTSLTSPRDTTPASGGAELPKRSPPKGRAFRHDGKRLPAMTSGAAPSHGTRGVHQQSPTLGTYLPASREPAPMAQSLFDMTKEAQRQERAATPGLEEAAILEIAASRPSSTSSHGDRLFAIRAKPSEALSVGEMPSSPPTLPLFKHQNNNIGNHDRDTAMSSKSTRKLTEVGQKHQLARGPLSIIETPVPVPVIPVFDRSATRKRKHQAVAEYVEETSLPLQADVPPEQESMTHQTAIAEAPIPTPCAVEVEPRHSKRRKASTAAKETDVPKRTEASSRQDTSPTQPITDGTAEDQTSDFAPSGLPEDDVIPAATPSVASHELPVRTRATTMKGATTSPPKPKTGHLPPEKQPKTPSRPTSKDPVSRLSSARPSSSKLSIISLVSDDEDQDELSFDFGQPSWDKTHTPSGKPDKHVTSAASKRASSSVKKSGSTTINSLRMHKSHKDRAKWRRSTGAVLGSPSVEMVRTPGGTVRKCGEAGFRCDRDFCFVCL